MTIENKIINLNGKELLLRNANADDAEMLLEYLKKTGAETKFLIKEPEEITFTVEQEQGLHRHQ